MAAEAVVDEVARAALQRGEVRDVGVCLLQRVARRPRHPRSPARRADCQQERAQEAHIVTRAGSGFVLSMREYQGIARKNVKYTIVPITEIVVNGATAGFRPQ